MRNRFNVFLVALTFLCGYSLFMASNALAHCDGIDGPVVKAAQKALAGADINPVLNWVQKADEPEIRNAFAQTLAVRKLSPQAGELADRYFFETLVRLHRAGEGAPYTGLKPAGRDLGPAIPAADKALESRSVEALLKVLDNAVQQGVREHFNAALTTAGFRKDDVNGGREYVRHYVEFLHYVERIYEAATNPVSGHMNEQ